ncbi:hypothetical protein BJ742DRAFT_841083 [Cladochytrium replicatum]|nr:hypothetical protein BJ742DRAFT_841083 [Cladochytrium replicatum]
MCYKVTCSICHKPTWSGCGMHIESALRGVPKDQRCKCTEEEKRKAADEQFAKSWVGWALGYKPAAAEQKAAEASSGRSKKELR